MNSETAATPPLRPPTRTKDSYALVKIAIPAALTMVLMAVCYYTPVRVELLPLHNIHQHLFYIPIVLAAIWHGKTGGLIAAGLVFLFYVPHVTPGVHELHDRMTDLKNWGNINHLLEGGTYLLIGFMTGHLTDLLRAQQRRTQAVNAELAENSESLRCALNDLTARTSEVFAAEEQLRRADRLAALGQLTTGLAHEIRNPLGSIRGAAEILGDNGTTPLRRAEFSNILIAETERLDQVLANFLDYARSQRGELSGSCELAPILDRIVTLLGSKIEQARVRVEHSIPDDLPKVAVPEMLLHQSLLNLLLNGIQAMTAGGTLRVEAVFSEPTGRITISIADTGAGIPPEIADRIFDPFFTTKSTGTGLGLAIVHKIVCGLKGRVWLDGTSPAGSRFALELPAC